MTRQDIINAAGLRHLRPGTKRPQGAKSQLVKAYTWMSKNGGGRAGINMVTLSLADSKDFGILRLIVRQWERARDVLERAGISVTVTEVLALEVVDRPGGLAELLAVFEKAGINTSY